jgi:hypothetical protein
MTIGGATSPDWDSIPIAEHETRIWGADLYAWAYDWLTASQKWRGQAQPAELEADPQVTLWRDRIRGGGGWIPDDVLDSLKSCVARDGAVVPMLMLMVAIDRAYYGIRLSRPCIVPMVGALCELTETWEDKGSLELAADGLVLRKGSYWQAGSALAHYCNDLARVPETLRSRVAITTVTDAATLGAVLRDQGHDAGLTVAFVPTLDDMSMMAFRAVDRGKARLFDVELEPTTQEKLAAGAQVLIDALEREDVNIAFLPETVIEPAVMRSLRSALIRNNELAANQGGLPSLRVLVAGVNEPKKNYAVALAADGGTLVTQHKTQCWRLDEAQLKRYGLEADLGTETRVEDISEEARLSFIDDPGLGRLAVLICEDLARGDPAWLMTTAATPNVILGPICDGSLTRGRWAFKAGERLAEEPGALILIANSFVLSDREERRAKSRPVSEAGIGIVLHPDDRSQTDIVLGQPKATPPFVVRRITWSQGWL